MSDTNPPPEQGSGPPEQPPQQWGQQPPPPPPGGWSQQAPPPYQGGGYAAPGAPMSQFGQPLAEWWKRLVAWIIDGLVVGIPAGIVFNIIGVGSFSTVRVDPVTGETTGLGGMFVAIAVSQLLYQLIFLIYFAVMNGSEKGQTVGKMAMKIQVRAEAGGPIGPGPAALRYVIYGVLSLLTCGIGGLLDGLWPLWDSKRQALHDKVVNSVVVDAPA